MHILILNSEYPPIGGGASNASANIASQLVKLGQQVTVLTAAYKDLPRDEMTDGVRILRLPGLRGQVDRSTTGEQIVFMFSAALAGLVKLPRLRPDVVLAFFGAPSGVAAWFWSHIIRLPYIVSLRGGDVPGFRPYDFARQHRVLSPLLRRVWKRAGAVVANSEGLRGLGAVFEPRVPIQVIPNGVDLEVFHPGEKTGELPRLLFVGRIVYQKGLDLLFSALGELKDMAWRLDLAGDGPSVERLSHQAAALGIAARVQFLGWQSREGLPGIYQQADLFVNPSRHEGMPNTVLEAMASGLPVLATRIAGNEELVNAETGVLTPAEDIEALTTALRTLLLDADLRKRMGVAARKRVEESYSWQRVAQVYLDLMHKVVEQG
ncbi:MAG: glycosyltransferase family 4 protein [Anaerolineales bacterium]